MVFQVYSIESKAHYYRGERIIVDNKGGILYDERHISMLEGKSAKEGIVVEAFKGGLFRVKLNDSNGEVMAYLAGKMRLHYIKVLVGDRVRVEFSQYDKERGRIVQRL